MQGLASPQGHPESPIKRGPPRGYPEDVPAQGGYGRGSAPPLPFPEGPALPDRPPFKAYLGNIPYDLDEEVVVHFFRGLDVSVTLPCKAILLPVLLLLAAALGCVGRRLAALPAAVLHTARHLVQHAPLGCLTSSCCGWPPCSASPGRWGCARCTRGGSLFDAAVLHDVGAGADRRSELPAGANTPNPLKPGPLLRRPADC